MFSGERKEVEQYCGQVIICVVMRMHLLHSIMRQFCRLPIVFPACLFVGVLRLFSVYAQGSICANAFVYVFPLLVQNLFSDLHNSHF